MDSDDFEQIDGQTNEQLLEQEMPVQNNNPLRNGNNFGNLAKEAFNYKNKLHDGKKDLSPSKTNSEPKGRDNGSQKEKNKDPLKEPKKNENSNLPESVKKKKDEVKAKDESLKPKLNETKKNMDPSNKENKQMKPAKAQLNEKAFRTAVKSTVDAVLPGAGEVANKLLDSPLGKQPIEEARAASNSASAVVAGTKKLIAIIKKIISRKSILMSAVPTVLLLMIVFLVIIALSNFINPFNYFRGNNSGTSGIAAVDKKYKDFYEYVEKYGNSNKAMVIAVLSITTSNNDLDNDALKGERVELCSEDEISSDECVIGNESGVETLSKSKLKKYIKKINKEIQDSGGDISEGDYNDPENTGSKFFQWLYKDFIEDYYGDRISKDSHEDKKRIIRSIYLLYSNLIKTNSNCSNSFVNLTCPSVTVTGSNAGSYNFEDYIAAVVANELGYSGFPQAMRAQAIAARTFLLERTDNCQKSIENSERSQTMEPGKVRDDIREAVQDTAGMVLTKEGSIFSAQYSTVSKQSEFLGGGKYKLIFKRLPSGVLTEGDIIDASTSALGIDLGGFNWGHDYGGMSQYAALYYDKQGKSYQDILKIFYDDDVEISTTPMSNAGRGLIVNRGYCGPTGGGLVQIDGYTARLERPARNNQFFYSQSTGYAAVGLEGECAWYATGRAKEILSTLGINQTWNDNPNGAEFCNTSDAHKFNVSEDVTKPLPGSIISWDDGGYGHVAIVEKVEGDNVTISQAGLSFGATYICRGCSSGSCARSCITGPQYRKNYCESNGSGCFSSNTYKISQLSNLYGQQFKCYIYLTQPK